MRNIKFFAIHCKATLPGDGIDWKVVGYDYIIDQFGKTTQLLPITQVSNGVAGLNHEIINIAYIGGFTKNSTVLFSNSVLLCYSKLTNLGSETKLFRCLIMHLEQSLR